MVDWVSFFLKGYKLVAMKVFEAFGVLMIGFRYNCCTACPGGFRSSSFVLFFSDEAFLCSKPTEQFAAKHYSVC